MTLIPIAQPLLGDEEKQAVLEVIDSGRLAQGPRVQRFEEAFAAMCGVREAVAVSSGTTALMAALLACGIGAGDEVITSPFTFIATANAIVFTGARPVFVDVSESDFNIDPALIEAKITSNTKAILPVHLYGHPADMEQIMRIAGARGLAVIEDASQAHGAAIDRRRTGSFGAGCFSFYATKNMTTAEGGMITTDDPEIARRARLLRDHGETARYHSETLGYNFRMTEIQAAIGLVQLSKLHELNERRRANARFLTENLRSVITPRERPGCRHVYHQYTVRVPSPQGGPTARDALAARLLDAGIQTSVHYPLPVHRQPLYLQMGYRDELPVAERLSDEVLSLPVHPGLTEYDLAAIVKAVNESLPDGGGS
ncbi:MAG: DegT/DnrJ/EryC1/StrS family aminotransferase [Dehalococcoidia bacterium]|nr:DegT/DnrJ/EryC1/StrS family aminotransferase [Dehalococcoidia bacterium]